MPNNNATLLDDSRSGARWRTVARMLALGVVVLGAAAFVGWVFNIDSLKRVRPGWVSMNPASIVAFVLTGMALFCTASPPWSRWSTRAGAACAGIATLIGLLCLVHNVAGLDLGIDRILFAPRLDDGQTIANRMAPNTAACFMLAGIALLLTRTRFGRWRALAGVLVTAAGVIALLALVGYANGVSSLSTVGPLISMAAHTAAGFVLLSAGILCLLYARAVATSGADAQGPTPDDPRSFGSVKRKTTIGFAAALVVMSIVGIASYKSLKQFLADSEWNNHIVQVIDAIENLASELKDAETGARGFVISGKDNYLEPYRAAFGVIGPTASQLRTLTSDNPRQQQRLATLEPLIDKKLSFMQRTIAVRRDEGFEPARLLVVSGEGTRTMDEIRAVLAAMNEEERGLLATRTAAADSDARVSVMVVSAGSFLGVVLVGLAGLFIRRDIARRLTAERALRESERQMRFLADAMPQIIWTARPDGGVDYYNSQWHEYTGMSFEQTKEWGWKPVLHPNDLAVTIEQWTRSVETGEIHEMEHRFKRADDGTYRWHLTRGIPRRDEHGRIVQWVGTCTDVHDQKLAEEELKRSRAFLDAVIENIPHMVFIKDAADLRFVLFNRAGEKLTGLNRKDLLNRSDTDLFAPEQATQFIAKDRETLARCVPLDIPEEPLTISAAGTRILHTQKIPMLDETGTPRFLLGISEDITERRLADQQIRHAKRAAETANKAKSEFLAHMSHEIRTPLNGVMGMADLLLGTELTEQQRRYAKLAKTSAESLTTVINDILDFSKMEAGKLEIVPTDFNLHLAVEDVMEVLAQIATKKGLEIACHVDPAVPPMVRGDQDRLRQILINLVSNAIKFTQHGAVVVRLSPDAQSDGRVTVRFTVSDTGVGIPRDRIDRLFKSFSQADASTTRVYGGTGLGLAIAKQLAELMGGTIGVESEPGRGSTFWFTITFESREQPAAPAVPRRVDPATLRVLAVDDNEIHREVLRQQIASWGLDAATAPDGEQALKLLADAAATAAPFRVALVDSDMPGMDGFELATVVKSRSDICATALMILLSVDANVPPERLRAMGFAGQLTKPVRQSQLFDAIINALAADNQDPSPAMPALPEAAVTPSDAEVKPKPVLRVLVAEDNEINQIVAREMLSQAGFECHIVGNGKQAVEAVKAQRYDLVLMDCQMPEMDGFDSTREIRRMEAEGALTSRSGPRLPIVALTANAMKGDDEACLNAGMDAYASKPIDPRQLLATIDRVLRAGSKLQDAA